MISMGKLLGCAMLGLAAGAQAQSWDAASQFSVAANPTGVWSYGYFDGTSFQTSLTSFTGPVFNGWNGANGQATVMQNVSGIPSYGIQPNHLSLECDFNAPILRFTAPITGAYDVFLQVGGTTEFQNGGFGNNWVPYALLVVNGLTITEDSFANNVKTWNHSVNLIAGDTVDASMSNHYGGGNTDTMMHVAVVPEPASFAVLGGLAVAVLLRRRKV